MSPEFWTNLGILLAAGVVALTGYYAPRILKAPLPPRNDPILTGIGVAFGDKEQKEREIAAIARAATALEQIAASIGLMADQDRAELKDALEELREQIRTRRPSPRRRPRAK